MDKPEVSILIPAYQAEGFIDRTLLLARGQTYARVSILVSVDDGDDNTADVVKRHMQEDSRIRLFEQSKRLGWARNVNFLLARVDAPYFFLYFHDDVILPQYTARLLAALQANPESASVHCDMGHFGANNSVSRGRPMQNTGAHRLLNFMLSPERSSPLRSLIRSALGGHLRLPANDAQAIWANEPFLLDLFAAGPAEHVADVLYFRWDQRAGGLTSGWKELSAAATLEGWKTVIESSFNVIDRVADTAEALEALTFGLYLKVYPVLRGLSQAQDPPLFQDPSELNPRFVNMRPTDSLDAFGEDIAGWAMDRWKLCRTE